ncbi:hypothetical protein O181_098632 [Austropuccinia psidii MF-1]|uniref:Uncharacterized protein n=1 Tax=Austropuccinia psidii MF-1 TaxID=1389203 RepID=A0A9Q3JBM9_9BASI|nr:hypothetical protein [Austropuccinia psidii MF-1]
MLTPAETPTAPNKQLLKEFFQQFSRVEEVQSVAQNSQGVKLINEAQVQTLCDARSGKRKVGKSIINMKDFYIKYVHEKLAKLGIPGNINICVQTLLTVMPMIVMCTMFKQKSIEEKGWKEQDVERKVVQKLCDSHYKFLIAHNYPKRYQVIASDVNAHSNDEYNAKAGVYDVDQMMGRRSYQQIHRRPKKPIFSKFEKTPKNIPIDFYRPDWFNKKNHSQKIMVADLGEVAFVPTKNLPPGSKEHPDERLGDLTFSNKYWDCQPVTQNQSTSMTAKIP